MRRFPILAATLAALLVVVEVGAARAATLESLIAGGTLETNRLKFDLFSYSPYAGAPSAAAINVLPVDQGDGWQGLTINGSFSSTTFSQGLIQYRVTAKSGGVVYAASLAGNPSASGSNLARLLETLGGGLPQLDIHSQNGSSTLMDDASFPTPRTSIIPNSGITLSGAVSSPSTLSIVQQMFRASALQADFDLDDNVDAADFLAWQRGAGTTGSNLRLQGDANSNGVVDGADLVFWRNQFGQTAAPMQAIPEPCGAALAAAIIAAEWLCRRRR